MSQVTISEAVDVASAFAAYSGGAPLPEGGYPAAGEKCGVRKEAALQQVRSVGCEGGCPAAGEKRGVRKEAARQQVRSMGSGRRLPGSR